MANGQISHVSFDVWNTLIEPNPEFARHRNAYLARQFNLTVEHVADCYTFVKRELDKITPHLPLARTVHQSYESLLQTLGVNGWYATVVRQTIERIFAEHPPTVMLSAPHLIKQLNERGYKVSIGSNTSLTSGHITMPFCEQNIGQFAFGVFSDIIGFKKPDARFFDHITDQVALVWSNGEQQPVCFTNEILHVGDNYECDFQGSRAIGMQSLHFKPTAGTLYDQVMDYMGEPL